MLLLIKWHSLCSSYPGCAYYLGCYVCLALSSHSSLVWWLCGTTRWYPAPCFRGLSPLGSATLVTEVKEALLCTEECGEKLLCPS